MYALGGFRVMVGGRLVDDSAWRRRSARQLFKILLGRPNRRMARDEISELLWPESHSSAASSNLRSTIHALRRVLEAAEPTASSNSILGDRESVWLRPQSELWLDADAFEQAIQQARGSTDVLPLLEQASALYAGVYLPDDVYEDWATQRRERLKQSWAQLQIRLSRELEQRGDAEGAARHLQRLLHADPCDESAAQLTMQLLARNGRRSDALRTYQRLIQALADELGVEPSDETQALYRQIMAGEIADSAVLAATFRLTYPFPAPAALIDRVAELAQLERLMAIGRTVGQAALVGAPAGTGKSALLGQLVKQAQAQGVLCLAGGCYEERGAVPLGPFHDALVDYLLAQPAERLRADLGSSVADLAQVVPELRYHLKLSDTASASSSTIDRLRAFGAIHACLRGLAERGPLLICLEDLHAADEATLQLFHYLARQTRRLPLVMVATYRSDEAPADQPLAQSLAVMMRERLVERVLLDSFGRSDTDRLLALLLDGSLSESLGESLFSTTGGNPLFVEQLVLALSETGQIQRKDGVWQGTTELQGSPHIVREIIAERLMRLTPSCREALATAAVVGKTFEHRVLLAAMAPQNESTLLTDLDRAITAHILQETVTGYAFRHTMLHEAVYWEMSAPRRMQLHAQIGELLERLHGARAEDYAAELAHHFTLAGDSAAVRVKALSYSMTAGRRAADLSSYPQALTHFSRAWALMESDSNLGDAATRLDALEGRGWAEAGLARWPETTASYRRALELAADPVHRARAHGIVAFTHQHTGDFSAALDECATGLAELSGIDGPEAVAARLHLQQLIAYAWYYQGRFRDVVELGRQMEIEATALGQPRSLMLAHNVVGWGFMGQGQVENGISAYQQALSASERDGEKIQRATTLENIGYQNYLGGRFSAARDYLNSALTLYRDSASELRSVNALQHLCQIWVAEGEHERARDQVVRALELELEGQERWAADGHHILGTIQTLQAEWEAAAQSFGQALGIRTRVGDMPGIVESTVGLGVVDQFAGRWAQATAAFVDAATIADAMDPAPQSVLAHRHLGRLRLLAGDRIGAAREIDAAFAAAEMMPESLEYAPALLALAELRAHDGEVEQAHELAERSLDFARQAKQVVDARVFLAHLHVELGDSRTAVGHATEAVALAVRLASPIALSQAHLAAGRAAATVAGQPALDSFLSALRHSEAARAPYERATVLHALADYLVATGMDLARAAALRSEARAIFARILQTPAEHS